jgi:hypothetical protein
MRFTSEHYFQAALERIAQAHSLHRLGSRFALAMYVAGVAVECMLRAFRLKRDPTFEERHDIVRLFKASGMLEIDPAAWRRQGLSEVQAESYARELRAAVNEIALLWSNDYRYASESRLRSHLQKEARLRSGVRGDLLKANAQRLLNAAQTFIDKGYLLWNSSRKPKSS